MAEVSGERTLMAGRVMDEALEVARALVSELEVARDAAAGGNALAATGGLMAVREALAAASSGVEAAVVLLVGARRATWP